MGARNSRCMPVCPPPCPPPCAPPCRPMICFPAPRPQCQPKRACCRKIKPRIAILPPPPPPIYGFPHRPARPILPPPPMHLPQPSIPMPFPSPCHPALDAGPLVPLPHFPQQSMRYFPSTGVSPFQMGISPFYQPGNQMFSFQPPIGVPGPYLPHSALPSSPIFPAPLPYGFAPYGQNAPCSNTFPSTVDSTRTGTVLANQDAIPSNGQSILNDQYTGLTGLSPTSYQPYQFSSYPSNGYAHPNYSGMYGNLSSGAVPAISSYPYNTNQLPIESSENNPYFNSLKTSQDSLDQQLNDINEIENLANADLTLKQALADRNANDIEAGGEGNLNADAINMYNSSPYGNLINQAISGNLAANHASHGSNPYSLYTNPYTSSPYTGGSSYGPSGSPYGSGGIPVSGSPYGSSGIPSSGSPYDQNGVQGTGSPYGSGGIPASGSPYGSSGIPSSGSPYDQNGVQSTGSPYGSGGVPASGSPYDQNGVQGTGSPYSSGGVQGTGSPYGSGGVQGTGSPYSSGGVQGTGSPYGSGGVQGTGSPYGSGGIPSSGSPYGSGGVQGTGSPYGSGGVPSSGSPYGSGGVPSSGSSYGSGGVPASGSPYGSGGIPVSGSPYDQNGVQGTGSPYGSSGIPVSGSPYDQNGVQSTGSPYGSSGIPASGSPYDQNAVPASGFGNKKHLFIDKINEDIKVKLKQKPKMFNVEVRVEKPEFPDECQKKKMKEIVIPLPLPSYCKPRQDFTNLSFPSPLQINNCRPVLRCRSNLRNVPRHKSQARAKSQIIIQKPIATILGPQSSVHPNIDSFKSVSIKKSYLSKNLISPNQSYRKTILSDKTSTITSSKPSNGQSSTITSSKPSDGQSSTLTSNKPSNGQSSTLTSNKPSDCKTLSNKSSKLSPAQTNQSNSSTAKRTIKQL